MPKRLPAEWEAQSAVQITFPHPETDWAPHLERVIPCFEEIISTICQFQKVLVVCKNKHWVAEHLLDCPKERLIYAEVDSDDSWARDHGGIAYYQDEQLRLYDFTFNGWGQKFPAKKDNQITAQLFEQGIFQLDQLSQIPFVLEGGSIESDGQGTLLTTEKCLLSPERNSGKNKAQIEATLKQFFGLSQLLFLKHGELIGDDTDAHIDTLARFCNPDTIAYVKCEDEKDEHHQGLAKMELELSVFKKLNGETYNLTPLPLPDPIFDEAGQRLPATYANFLIINEAVLVPTYGQEKDQIALDRLKPIFPNRTIIGIDCQPLILQHGSLHCVTMQYPKGLIL